MQKRLVFVGFCLLLALGLAAQSKLDGEWKGIVTQESAGGTQEFEITIRISKNGKKLSGSSIVKWGDKFARMSFVGKVERGVVIEIKEQEVVEKSELKGFDWCVKHMKLVLKEPTPGTLSLEGYWEGRSAFGRCDPGKIWVEKQIKRV